MKKFLLKVLLFFACVVVMDFAFGHLFSYLRIHAKGGSTANCEYIANKATAEIIILGSSRATHHYVPQIIEDSLGISCYNCGEEGNGVVLAYGRLKMLTDRFKPKLVIYEITPNYDYGNNEPDNKYLGYLRAYYNKDGISELFDVFDDEFSWMKMQSKMYQNTSRLLPNLFDNVIYRDNHQGYEPLSGQIKDTTIQANISDGKGMSIDSLKLSYVEKVIKLCQKDKIPIFFIISPRYGMKENDMSIYEPALSLCQKYNVSVYNYICCPSISERPELFQDEGHMNSKGAEAYSRIICKIIKNLIDK